MKPKGQQNENDWKTPASFYQPLNEEFNFDFDPCPLRHDLTLWDGLNVAWGERNFINPPYERTMKEAFVKKALMEAQSGKLCVLLLPVSTSTKLFHEVILPNMTEIRFVKGRIKFEGYNTKGEFTHKNVGVNDSMLVIFDGRKTL